MDKPLFSIIVPTFNPGDKLVNTLESILGGRPTAGDGAALTGTPSPFQEEGWGGVPRPSDQADAPSEWNSNSNLVEVIVVDGGSTDGTVPMLEAMAGRIRYISEPDQGLYDAMNKGIGLATGRFLNFQGAGDLLRPGILEAIAALMPSETPAFVYGRVFDVAVGVEVGEEFTPLKMRNGNVPHQAIFYSRDVFDLMGRYDLQYPILADYAYNIHCFGHPEIRKVYLDRVVADYEGGGVSTQKVDVRLYADLPILIRENLGAKAYWLFRAQNLVPMPLRRLRVRMTAGNV